MASTRSRTFRNYPAIVNPVVTSIGVTVTRSVNSHDDVDKSKRLNRRPLIWRFFLELIFGVLSPSR